MVSVSHCPNPPRTAVGSLNASADEVHILDNAVLEAATGSPATAGELWTSSEPHSYLISPITQLAKWKDGQREPEASQVRRNRRNTHVLDTPLVIETLRAMAPRPQPSLLEPLVPLLTVIIASVNHLPPYPTLYHNSKRYCHPHFTDRQSSSQSKVICKRHVSVTEVLEPRFKPRSVCL